MFTVCGCLPLISVTSHALPPSLPPHVLLHFSPPSLHLLSFFSPPSSPLQTMWPSHYTSWIIEVKPSTLVLPNKSQTSSPSLFPLIFPSLPSLLMVLFLNFDLWRQIRSQVSEGNMRFSFFSSLLELILRNSGHYKPAAHASLVTAGGRVLEDRLTAHIHIRRLQYLAWVVLWFWQHVVAYSTLVQLNQWKDYKCVSDEWKKGAWSLFNVFHCLIYVLSVKFCKIICSEERESWQQIEKRLMKAWNGGCGGQNEWTEGKTRGRKEAGSDPEKQTVFLCK